MCASVVRLGKGGYVYLGLVQKNISHLSDLTSSYIKVHNTHGHSPPQYY